MRITQATDCVTKSIISTVGFSSWMTCSFLGGGTPGPAVGPLWGMGVGREQMSPRPPYVRRAGDHLHDTEHMLHVC